MNHKLEADSILLSFGLRRILSDIYIKCETGKITGLLGRNGQGKTCLMNIICGNLKAESKSIRFDERTIYNAFLKPDLLSFLPQFNFIPKWLTVKRVLKDYRLDFAKLEVEFPEFGSKYSSPIKDLSGGQRRLLEVYIIIKSETQFALLDEPFSQLSPLHIEKMIEILNKEKLTKGILLTDHLYMHIIDICDSLYVLKDGKTHITQNFSDIERLGYLGL